MENEESKDEVKTVSADSINGDAELFKKSLKKIITVFLFILNIPKMV